MSTVVLFALLTTAAHYLGSRAMITKWLWSRYPPRLARFMDCAACSGFWYGLLFAALMSTDDYLGIHGVIRVQLTIAFCSIVTTPIAAGLMQKGFEWLGAIVQDEA